LGIPGTDYFYDDLLWDTYRLHAGVTNDGKGYLVPGQAHTLSCRNYTPFAWTSYPLAQGGKEVSQSADAGDRLILLKERTSNIAAGAGAEQV